MSLAQKSATQKGCMVNREVLENVTSPAPQAKGRPLRGFESRYSVSQILDTLAQESFTLNNKGKYHNEGSK